MLTGFILAAGFGTRLRPITDHVPKALVSVCGIPLLQHSLSYVHSQGIERIGVNTHHFPDRMIQFQSRSSIPFTLLHETGSIRGTGGALYFAKDFLSQQSDFFVCNVDIIASAPLTGLYEKFLDMKCLAGLVAVPVAQGGSICYDFVTKEYAGARIDGAGAGSGADFIGMAFYKKEFLSVLTADDFSIVPVWSRAREMGYSVKVLEIRPSYWIDAGTPAALAQVHFDVIEKKCILATPREMVIDAVKKRAYLTSCTPSDIERLGQSVWCEADSLPSDVFLERSVVFSNAVFPSGKSIQDMLVTPWGTIGF